MEKIKGAQARRGLSDKKWEVIMMQEIIVKEYKEEYKEAIFSLILDI